VTDETTPSAIEMPAPPVKMDAEQFAMAVQLVNMAQAMFAPWRMSMAEQDAQPNADMLLTMAMASFAGTIYGGLVGMGHAKSDDDAVDAVLETMAMNFRQGMDAGVKAYARAAEEALAQ
jgi:sugar (pentulose or hexulose) kinase